MNRDLTEEILFQKELVQAESGELSIKFSTENSYFIIKNSIDQIKHHEVAKNKKIEIVEDEKIDFQTDGVMVRRILMNLLKNALEASLAEEKVTIGCNRTEKGIRFWVHNSSVMHEKVKLQVFQRSFSTKGRGRGLGTYSIKLFGENYLKGKVSFTSEVGQGTTFFIDLPREI